MSNYPKTGDQAGYDYSSIASAVVMGNTNQKIDGTKTFLKKIYALGGVEGAGLGTSGYSGANLGASGYSGTTGTSGYSGKSGYSGVGTSGYSGIDGGTGATGSGVSGYSGYSGKSGYSGVSGYSGYSGISGYSGSGVSGYSGFFGSGISGYSGYSGIGTSGYSGVSGYSGTSGYSGISGYSGNSGYSGAGFLFAGSVTLADATTTWTAKATTATTNVVVLTPKNLAATQVAGAKDSAPAGVYATVPADGTSGFLLTHDNNALTAATGASFQYAIFTDRKSVV